MNLIVTCARHLESETSKEIQEILTDMGDNTSHTAQTKMSGIITVDTIIDPVDIVQEIRTRLVEEPWSIRYCLRIIPVQKLVASTIQEIESAVSYLIVNMNKDETYRITIEKRNSNISSKELIAKIAVSIKNKVSLELPDKIILIEILGECAGISVLRPVDILSITKTKRSF